MGLLQIVMKLKADLLLIYLLLTLDLTNVQLLDQLTLVSQVLKSYSLALVIIYIPALVIICSPALVIIYSLALVIMLVRKTQLLISFGLTLMLSFVRSDHKVDLTRYFAYVDR